MLRIKDWIKIKNHQFKIGYGRDHMIRLKDGKIFKRFEYFIYSGNIIDIMSFNSNMIHVDIRVYDDDKQFKHQKRIQINDL